MEENYDKKLETKRLVIYLILAFGLTWIIFCAYAFTGHRWDGSNPGLEQFVGLGMLMPFVAHILTRKITKEGFAMTGKDSVMLGISFQDGKWKWYVFALLIPWIYMESTAILEIILVPSSFDPEYIKELGFDKIFAYSYPLMAISSAAIASFAALGEEGGWRGYMMPKLIKLIGIKKAILVGGVIWGVWHAPLTCIGHNFGTDYPGFPYSGILIMCVLCILMGVMLTFITIKSESVWPAAIMHAVNNAGPSILNLYINGEIFREKMSIPLISWSIMFIPIAVIDIIIIMAAKRRKR